MNFFDPFKLYQRKKVFPPGPGKIFDQKISTRVRIKNNVKIFLNNIITLVFYVKQI